MGLYGNMDEIKHRKRAERRRARVEVLIREGLTREEADSIATFLEQIVAAYHRGGGGETT